MSGRVAPPRRGPERPPARRSSAARPDAPAPASFLERHGTAVVLALAAAQAAFVAVLCWRKFQHFLYGDFDLAIFAHAAAGILRGTTYESIGGMSWLGGHVALVMFLVAPLWALAPHPFTLLALQAVALAAGAVPLHRLVRRETGSAAAGVWVAAAWLLVPAIGYSALFEFHPETLATPALLFAIEALRGGRLRATLLWTAFALTTREDVALAVLVLAAVAAFRRDGRRLAFAGSLAGLALLSLVVSFGFVLPHFGGGHTDYATMYGRWGTTFREVAAAALAHPLRVAGELVGTPGDAGDTLAKRIYLVQMLLPFALLPLAAPSLLAPALPILLEHFLSSRPSQHAIVFHYTSVVTPFVAAAGAAGLARVATLAGRGRPSPRTAALLGALVLACAALAQVLHGPVASLGLLQGMGRPGLLVPDEYERTLGPHRRRLLAAAPRSGDVVAGFEFLTRFTNRPGLHSLHHLIAGHYTFSNRPYSVPRGVTTVLADLGAGSLFKHVDDGTAGRWRELISANGLVPRGSADDLVLWAAGGDSVALWTVAEPARPRERPVAYDGTIAFVGGESDSAVATAGGLLPVRTYWRRLRPTDRFYLTEFLLVDAQSRPHLELWRYLGYTLHPPGEWPGGASVCETYRLALPPGLAPGRYHLGVRLWWRRDGQGVCEPDDPAARAEQGYVRVAGFEVRRPL